MGPMLWILESLCLWGGITVTEERRDEAQRSGMKFQVCPVVCCCQTCEEILVLHPRVLGNGF